MDIWQELEIAPTDDRGAILRAYAQRLSKVRPEVDPEGAERLRLAYEAALSGAYDSVPEPPPDAPTREERLESSRQAAQERAAAALVAAGPEAPGREERAPDQLFGEQAALAERPLDPLMEPAVDMVEPQRAVIPEPLAAVDEPDDWAALSAPSLDPQTVGPDSGPGEAGAPDPWPEPAAASADPLAADSLAADSLAADPLAADPLAAGPSAADPLSADPLVADPLTADPLATDGLGTEPSKLAYASRTLGDLPASAAPESGPDPIAPGDLELADEMPDTYSAEPNTAPVAPSTLNASRQEAAPSDGGAFATARGRRSESIRTARRTEPERTGGALDAWRDRFGKVAQLLAWCDRLRAFLASNKYAEMAVLVLVLLALGMATFYGSPFDVIGAGVALLCLSGLMRPGSGLLLLFGTLASWLGSIVLMRQGTLLEIDKATLFMLLLLTVFGMIKLADRLEERAATRTGR